MVRLIQISEFEKSLKIIPEISYYSGADPIKHVRNIPFLQYGVVLLKHYFLKVEQFLSSILFFFQRSLRRKILLGFLIVLFIMLLMSFWGIYNIYKVSQNYKQTLYQNYTSIIAIDNIGKSLDDMMDAVLKLHSNNYDEGKTKIETSKAYYYLWFQKAKETAFTEQEKILLDSLGIEYSSFLNLLDKYEKYFGRQTTNTSVTHSYFANLIDLSIQMKSRCYSIFVANHHIIYTRVQNLDSISNTATILLIFIVLGGIFLSFIFSSKFSNYLTKPLQQLTNSAKHISAGNFGDRISMRNKDEIGNLAHEFNKMSEKLDKYEKINISKLLYEKKKSEAVLESINEPVIMINSRLELLMANKSFKELLMKDDASKILKEFGFLTDPAEAEEHKRNDRVVQINLPGGRKYFKIVFSEIILPESGEQGFVIVFNDITKFQEIDNMKSEFLGKVSHELKTPLTSVGMALGIMEDEIVGQLTKGQQNLVQSMKEDYNRLNGLVHEILELTKLESGNFLLQFNVIDLNEMIDHLIRNFSLQSNDKHITMKTCSDELPALVNADYEYLFRAIENIISNALKFTPEGGEIVILVKRSGNHIVLNIKDTGIGIPSEKVSDIFNKFVQINDGIPGSVGLGLSIAKEIIDMHNGEISVTSTPGTGSDFQIKLAAAEYV